MKNTTILIFVIAIAAVVGGLWYFRSGTGSITGNVVSDDTSSGTAQEITLSMKNYNYYPNTINVKVGQPVSITLDSSVSGCFRSFTIKDFGVSKYSKTPADKIVFTPDRKGTFRFACGMGMGYGTIVVE